MIIGGATTTAATTTAGTRNSYDYDDRYGCDDGCQQNLRRMRAGTGGRGRGQGRGASSEAEAADAEEEETKEKGTTQQPPGGSFGTMYR